MGLLKVASGVSPLQFQPHRSDEPQRYEQNRKAHESAKSILHFLMVWNRK